MHQPHDEGRQIRQMDTAEDRVRTVRRHRSSGQLRTAVERPAAGVAVPHQRVPLRLALCGESADAYAAGLLCGPPRQLDGGHRIAGVQGQFRPSDQGVGGQLVVTAVRGELDGLFGPPQRRRVAARLLRHPAGVLGEPGGEPEHDIAVGGLRLVGDAPQRAGGRDAELGDHRRPEELPQ